MIQILHNPQCSKSNCALDYLKNHNIDFELRDYQQQPLSVEELKEVCRQLQVSPESLVRKNEQLFQEQFSDKAFTEEEWFFILSENPSLLQRPIVLNGAKGVVARPVERIQEIVPSPKP